MRKFILTAILALATLGSASISTAEAQLLQRGTLFRNAYNRAPYYNMNSSPGPYFGSGRYNSSYYNSPNNVLYNSPPYYGGPSAYYGNSAYSMPYYNNSYVPPYYSGYRFGIFRR
jgi:hypothetical protein